MDLFIQEIQKGVKQGKTIIIVSVNQNNEKQIREVLSQKMGLDYESKITIEQGELSTGFDCFDFKLLVISTRELFIAPKKKKRISSEFKQGETIIFSDLKVRRLCSSQNKWNRYICWSKYNKSRWNYKRLYKNKIQG